MESLTQDRILLMGELVNNNLDQKKMHRFKNREMKQYKTFSESES